MKAHWGETACAGYQSELLLHRQRVSLTCLRRHLVSSVAAEAE